MPTQSLDITLAQAALGRRVFPINRDAKTPLVKWKEGATTDEAMIRRWFERWPDAQVGWNLPEGTFVVDIDHADVFSEAGLRVTDTARQETPRGEHFLYLITPGKEPKQGPIPGGDLKVGGKGYVKLYSEAAFTNLEPKELKSERLDPILAARAASAGASAADESGRFVLTTNPEIYAWACRVQGQTGVGEYGLFGMLIEMLRDGVIQDSDPEDPWDHKALRQIAHQAGLYAKDRELKIVNIPGKDRPLGKRRPWS